MKSKKPHKPGVFVNVGNNNFVNSFEVMAIVSILSNPINRLKTEAQKNGTLVDVTQGKKAKTLLVMSSGHMVLCSVEMPTLAERLNAVRRARKFAENGEIKGTLIPEERARPPEPA
ncbi:MAG: DUF370 domain-containing protein [Deltaproteobacteria bacterium]|jgi:regulator of extracellular matrix RemA (YlzA/DUF370 family)|nr:DUF370 domain-containing protein [Deltaproteobacteria bacterium]